MNINNMFQKSLENMAIDSIRGEYPIRINGNSETSLFGSGVLLNIGKDEITSPDKNKRQVMSSAPQATVLVKKKFFSGFMHNNDLQWMDRTEKLLLRTTKALFAYKVAQIRAYESLTKLQENFKQFNELNLNLFVDALNQSQLLSIPGDDSSQQLLSIMGSAITNSLANLSYDEYREDILKIMHRNAFSTDNMLTTWIVDPTSVDNYSIGPGTGVIELANIFTFSTSVNNDTSPSSASFSMVDPYNMLNISHDDIEIAIKEALFGTFNIFESMIDGDTSISNLDTLSATAAGLELLGIGNLDSTLDIDYIRDRMRVFYLGKSIVNAGDTVHFFIKSGKVLHEQDDFIDESYYEIDDVILEAERNLFTNKKIDLKTYKNIRRYSDNSFGMKHIFAGIANKVDHSFSGGSWKAKVDLTDNMTWLKWSKYMEEPSLSDPQGILEDPLTPYVLKKDKSGRVLSAGGTQLLNENKALLKSGLLAYDSGILNGQVATENNLLQSQVNFDGSLKNTKILQHPHGLIYRWKTGILTATAGITVNDSISEDAVSANLHRQYYALQVAQGVLNNLDVANILSVLIVGQPYNVESFIQQAYQVHNINKSSAASSLDGTDPLSGVFDVVRRQNKHFGNFRPYKMITMSNRTMNESLSYNLLRKDINDKLSALRSRKIELERRKSDLTTVTGDSPSILVATLEKEISNIDLTINEQIRVAQESSISSGDAFSENFNLFGRNRALPLTGNFEADSNVTRAMMLVGAQRRIEDVRLNRDQNLFIVSDQYDANTEIRSFLLALKDSQYKVFQGQYVSVYEKCEAAAKIPNFEFFCNSQGHLEFRPPQWNKTPLTVLRELFKLKKEKNIKVIPDFLEDMFETKVGAIKFNVHYQNIRIAMIALLLGSYPDRSIIPGIQRVGNKSLGFFGIKSNDFTLKTSAQQAINDSVRKINNTIGFQLSLDISLSEDGNILNGDTSTLLGQFDPIFQEQNNVFQNVLTINSGGGSSNARSDGFATPESLNAIRDIFISSYGKDPALGIVSQNARFTDKDFVYSNNSTTYDSSDSISKVNKYLLLLQEAVSTRDQYVSTLNQLEKQRKELGDVEDILQGDLNNQSAIAFIDKAYNITKSTNDIFNGSAIEGSLFDHLIEDDTKNLLGPGSGKRFIIDDVSIVSANFSEQPPDGVRVNVYGNAPFIGASNQAAFDNTYYWAGATDFDMWRQYGYKEIGETKLPYANNSETQCRPFAYMQLQNERIKINTASITVIGNEYYEPGDVVFVKSKGLLYYVTNVSHSFDYKNSFSTSLTLINGHPPGIYLPSPLDIIGQQLTKNDPTHTTLTYRNINGDNKYRVLQPDCALIFPPGPLLNINQLNVLLDYKDNNVRFTNMMIDLSTVVTGNRMILIRGFLNKNEPDEQRVANNIALISSLLQNPQMLIQSGNRRAGFNVIGDDILDVASSTLRRFGSDTGSTKNVIDMKLPNGLPVRKIEKSKIIEQTVFLGSDPISEVKCLNSKLAENLNFGDSGILPLGGPKQKTFLDIRDDLTQVSNIIEIGIIDINSDIIKNDNQTIGIKFN